MVSGGPTNPFPQAQLQILQPTLAESGHKISDQVRFLYGLPHIVHFSNKSPNHHDHLMLYLIDYRGNKTRSAVFIPN